MKKRIAAVLLALAVSILFLTGCGESAGSAQSTEDKGGKIPGGAAQSAVSQPTETPQEAPEEIRYYGGFGDLYSFRTWALEAYPDTVIGVAYLGDSIVPYMSIWDQLNTNGYAPFLTETSWENILEVECDQRVDVWAVVPLEEDAELLVEAIDWYPESASAVPYEELFRGTANGPLLICTDANNPDPQARIFAEDSSGLQTEMFASASKKADKKLPAMPNGGGAFDFTVDPDTTPAADWRLMGTWTQRTDSSMYSAEVLEVDAELTLQQDGYALYQVREAYNHTSRLALYEGLWTRTGLDEITLNLHLAGGVGDASAGLPEVISGRYGFTLLEHNKIELQCRQDADELLEDQKEHGLRFGRRDCRIFPEPVYGSEEAQALSVVLNYHNSNVGPADASGKVITEQTGILVRVSDGGYDESHGLGWYVVNPYALEDGYNWITGEPIDFTAYQDNGGSGMNQGGASAEEDLVCAVALAYYQMQSGGYAPGFVEVDGRDADGITVHLYDDMGTHTATCAWYVIDPETLLGYDSITLEEIDFSAAAAG